MVQGDELPYPRPPKELTVAYLGPAGTHSHLAALELFGPVDELGFRYEPRKSLTAVLDAVRGGAATWGVVPYFNTTSGPVRAVYPALLDAAHGAFENLEVSACLNWPVSHDLLGIGPREKVRRVYSKQEAIDQCTGFINQNALETIAVDSTAAAVRRAERDGPEAGAIASSRLCAFRPGLKVLAHQIEDDHMNVTRFLVVRRRDDTVSSKAEETDWSRHTWIVFESSAETGVLTKMLSAAREWAIAASTLTGLVTDPGKFRMRFLLELDWPPHSLKMQFFLADTEHLPRTIAASPIVVNLEKVQELRAWIRRRTIEAGFGPSYAGEQLLDSLAPVIQNRLRKLKEWRLYAHGPVQAMADVWGVLGLPAQRMVNSQVFVSDDLTGQVALCCVPGNRRASERKVTNCLGSTFRRLPRQGLANRGLFPGTVSPLTVPDGTLILMDSGFTNAEWVFMGSGHPNISIAVWCSQSWPFPATIADIAE